jgi:hypothetical protein
MKLVGGKIEQEHREQLIKSNQSLFMSEEKRKLLEVIKSSFPEMKTAFIIQWIPEQAEDIYKILINDSIIAEIELARFEAEIEPMIKSESVSQYLHGLNSRGQIKLAVALDLAKYNVPLELDTK